jgi:hypothetical protein
MKLIDSPVGAGERIAGAALPKADIKESGSRAKWLLASTRFPGASLRLQKQFSFRPRFLNRCNRGQNPDDNIVCVRRGAPTPALNPVCGE